MCYLNVFFLCENGSRSVIFIKKLFRFGSSFRSIRNEFEHFMGQFQKNAMSAHLENRQTEPFMSFVGFFFICHFVYSEHNKMCVCVNVICEL